MTEHVQSAPPKPPPQLQMLMDALADAELQLDRIPPYNKVAIKNQYVIIERWKYRIAQVKQKDWTNE